MKNSIAAVVVLIAAFASLPFEAAGAQKSEFGGVEKEMPSRDYEAAGLQKLTADERARLDQFIRSVVSSSSEKAATEAVDRAVKERKVHPPEVIQSRIVGPFSGYNGRTTFILENGQKWAQSQRDSAYFPKIDSPPVLIMKGTIGYSMYIAGGGVIRVTRVH